MCLPYAKAPHAGGKIFNYYIEQFSEDIDNEVTLIAKVLPGEESYIERDNQRFQTLPVRVPKSAIKRYISYIKSINSKINPFYKYGNTLTKEIYDQIRSKLYLLNNNGYSPDVIILEWTSMLLFIKDIKIIFPKAKYVAVEHDVTFLGKERKYKYSSNFFDKAVKKITFNNMKKRELLAINECDLVVTLNHKDRKILVENGINDNKLDVIAPYYKSFQGITRVPNRRDILFYGAMNRIENYSSALWFIENVMDRLIDCDIRFIVLGNKPPRELLKENNEKIIVTGFVDDVSPYFTTAMCLVAPLLLGAGIKVKIIEALSAGLPVLTNDIGIEGIDAEDGKHYIHCTSADDYEQCIRNLLDGETDTFRLSQNAQELIKEKYDIIASFKNYSETVYRLF